MAGGRADRITLKTAAGARLSGAEPVAGREGPSAELRPPGVRGTPAVPLGPDDESAHAPERAFPTVPVLCKVTGTRSRETST